VLRLFWFVARRKREIYRENFAALVVHRANVRSRSDFSLDNIFH